jgi:hypothetical protein
MLNSCNFQLHVESFSSSFVMHLNSGCGGVGSSFATLPFKHYNARKPYSQQERYSMVCYLCDNHMYNYEDLNNGKNCDFYRLNLQC